MTRRGNRVSWKGAFSSRNGSKHSVSEMETRLFCWGTLSSKGRAEVRQIDSIEESKARMSRVLNAELRLQPSLYPFPLLFSLYWDVFFSDLGLRAFLWRYLLHLVAFHGEFVQSGLGNN